MVRRAHQPVEERGHRGTRHDGPGAEGAVGVPAGDLFGGQPLDLLPEGMGGPTSLNDGGVGGVNGGSPWSRWRNAAIDWRDTGVVGRKVPSG